MPHFTGADGTSLYYDDQGEGTVVLLLHGFVGDVNIDWVRSGILDRLLDEGYRTVGYDARGHGLSDKPHDTEAYSGEVLARDAMALLDALGVASCFVVGFSMGARTALHLATLDERVQGVVALGVGENSLRLAEGIPGGASMSDVLLTDDPDAIEPAALRHYREMADAIRADRVALAALMSAPKPEIVDFVDQVSVPVLIVTGSEDVGAGSPDPLAARLADAEAVTTAGDHAGVKDQYATQQAIVEYLAKRA
ncbi:MAG TPA: alpha/beta fold hydrolase [Acidimicrobiia bacterium]|nr:alpha/beta fold hydrolase [Acidimicrobiia bacterium]